ncbi:MAG: Asp-tRNA(Asn)/Glu-tRNA(Gln) amidotransferase A subunit family amidase [Gammaproteobacteria bacterium]|jgi:Asp-tRNA(Asn)/Glu-tRNA(Gln) amidotransferase A subunit family amidase
MAFSLEETTIAKIHASTGAGETTAGEIVHGYRARTKAYDGDGGALYSIVTVNQGVIDNVAELDWRSSARGGLCGPLHEVLVVVKDQVEPPGT